MTGGMAGAMSGAASGAMSGAATSTATSVIGGYMSGGAGTEGTEVEVKAGDVILLPVSPAYPCCRVLASRLADETDYDPQAGVAHCSITSSDHFAYVGLYPEVSPISINAHTPLPPTRRTPSPLTRPRAPPNTTTTSAAQIPQQQSKKPPRPAPYPCQRTTLCTGRRGRV